MPNANDALILNILISVAAGPNNFPNIDFLKNTSWAAANAVPDNQPLGQGLFKKVAQTSYEQAQANLNAPIAAPGDVKNDAFTLTRSMSRLADTGGAALWDGGFPHPGLPELSEWVTALKA